MVLFVLGIIFLSYTEIIWGSNEAARNDFKGLFNSVAENNGSSADFYIRRLKKDRDEENKEFDALKHENLAKRVHAYTNESFSLLSRRDVNAQYNQFWQKEERRLNIEIEKVPEVERTASFYRNKVIHCRIEKREEMIERLGSLRTDKETNVLWLIRVRSAIEFFEDEYFQGEFTKAEWAQIKKLKGRERSRLIRRLKFRWIFANKNTDEEPAVQDLVKRIQLNENVKTTDKFCALITLAYSDLSASIHSYVMLPGGGNVDVELSTRYPTVNAAVELFWKTFEFGNYIVKPADFTPSATSTSTPAASSSTPAASDSTPQPPEPATE